MSFCFYERVWFSFMQEFSENIYWVGWFMGARIEPTIIGKEYIFDFDYEG